DQKRGAVRPPRRLRSDPRLLRADDPPPARPQRRPATQPRAAHDPGYEAPRRPGDDRLHRATNARGQDQPRGDPMPQALPRPQPLPTARERANADLTFIEASLAQPSVRVPDLAA